MSKIEFLHLDFQRSHQEAANYKSHLRLRQQNFLSHCRERWFKVLIIADCKLLETLRMISVKAKTSMLASLIHCKTGSITILTRWNRKIQMQILGRKRLMLLEIAPFSSLFKQRQSLINHKTCQPISQMVQKITYLTFLT